MRYGRLDYHANSPAQCCCKKGTPYAQAIGRSRRELSAKIHAVNALANPAEFYLTLGQAHDLQDADVAAGHAGPIIIVDKAHGAQTRLIEPLLRKRKAVVISSRAKVKQLREYDCYLYKACHLMENFFARLKQYRAIVTCYDKMACNFLSPIHLAVTMVWLILQDFN